MLFAAIYWIKYPPCSHMPIFIFILALTKLCFSFSLFTNPRLQKQILHRITRKKTRGNSWNPWTSTKICALTEPMRCNGGAMALPFRCHGSAGHCHGAAMPRQCHGSPMFAPRQSQGSSISAPRYSDFGATMLAGTAVPWHMWLPRAPQFYLLKL